MLLVVTTTTIKSSASVSGITDCKAAAPGINAAMASVWGVEPSDVVTTTRSCNIESRRRRLGVSTYILFKAYTLTGVFECFIVSQYLH